MLHWSYKSYTAVLVLLLLLPFSAWALEVTFPSVQGVEVTDSMGPAQWIRYIFLMSQALVGLAIIYALVRSGVEWMTARGNEGQVKTARDRIMGAILGLIILLGSYIFLKTINPQLVQLRNPSVPVPKNSGLDFYRNLFGQVSSGGGINDQCNYTSDCNESLICRDQRCVTPTATAENALCVRSGDCESGEACADPKTGESLGYNVSEKQGVCRKMSGLR